MLGKVYDWPRLIGGPLNGEPIPEVTDRSLIGYTEQGIGTGYYHEMKYLFGPDIAIRVLVYEGSPNARYDEMMRDVIVHALASVGITVPE